MFRSSALVVLTLTAMSISRPALSQSAMAQSLDDYLQRGYHISSRTYIPGSFNGCVRNQLISLANGSSFRCTERLSEIQYSPRVYILSQGTDQPSILMIGGRAVSGSLVSLNGRQLNVPLTMKADRADQSPVLPPSPARISRVAPIGSSDKDYKAESIRLNDAQAIPIMRPVP